MNDTNLVIQNDEQWLPVTEMQAGDLQMVYEAGRIRYITWRGHEIVRMIFVALRDEEWTTIPYTISEEKISQNTQEFEIQFKADFESADLRFAASFLLGGKADGTVTYRMEGQALQDFSTKRTGICVHHPVNTCAGEPVMILGEKGTIVHAEFPQLISPHPPFTDVAGMRWRSKEGIDAELVFEGDIFETEDQRNWTDDSYKTYSGPQYRVPIIHLKKGDTIFHKVTLRVTESSSRLKENETTMLQRQSHFPGIGYAYGPALDPPVAMMQELPSTVPFDHLLFQVHVNSNNLAEEVKHAAEISEQYAVQARLQVYCEQFSPDEINLLINAVNHAKGALASILLLPAEKGAPDQDGYIRMYMALKKNFPALRIGYGSSGWFANLNLSLPKDIPCDFVGFLVNPQVHQTDHRSILENLLSLHSLLQTLREQLGQTPVQVLFQFSKKPDARWRTGFGAIWVLNAIFNLAAAESLTIADLQGWQGILENPLPLMDHLKKISQFGPVSVKLARPVFAPSPLHTLRATNIVLENGTGERMYVSMQDI